MYQRQQRQNLGGTTASSPFFTSHEPNRAASAASSSSSVDVNYGYGGGGAAYASNQSPSYYGNSGGEMSAVGSSTYYGDDKTKSTRGGGGISYRFFMVWTLLLFVAAFGYVQWVALPKQRMEDVQVEEEDVEELRHQWKSKYNDLKKAHSKLQDSFQTLEQTARDNRRMLDEAEEIALTLDELHVELSHNQQWALEWKEKSVGLENSQETLRQAIQEVSRRQVIQKFGPGPFSVELEVEISGEFAYLTLELAPLDEMPHTVWFFLNQVDQGLYNHADFGFKFNAPHVTQAGTFTQEAKERFHGSGLGEVLVTEYSHAFPHETYTVGLTGRPGGPNFYINTRDNSKWHGPGGYAADGSADACFGRITRGSKIIDRIRGLTGDLHDGDRKDIQPSPSIHSMKVL